MRYVPQAKRTPIILDALHRYSEQRRKGSQDSRKTLRSVKTSL